MTRPLLAMCACYALGLVAGRADKNAATSQQVCAPARTAIVVDAEPVVEQAQTPLVEKLLPKSEPATIRESRTVQDGQLSPRGQWRWSQAQWAWVPVKQAGPSWVQSGHSATIDHLVREHGYKRADLVRLTQQQLDVLHSNAHNASRGVTRSSNVLQKSSFGNTPCPTGRCPRR